MSADPETLPAVDEDREPPASGGDGDGGGGKKKFEFPSAITILVIVVILTWIATLFISSGRYKLDELGAPIAGTFREIPSPLSFGEKLIQLIKSPINGTYGIQGEGGFVDTELAGFLFGSIGVVVFIFSLGIFISVSFATRALEVGIAHVADRLRTRGWLLIVTIMVLFSLLGSTMGFSVETFGFYALFLPLMAALGYDRMTTSAMIILGACTGAMASTVNPFSIGVASGEAGVSIGDGIGLRIVLWVVLTSISTAWVVRYAQRVRSDPSVSLTGFDPDDIPADAEAEKREKLTGVQKAVLVITVLTFALLIFSVIPWSSILGSTAGPAEYDTVHTTTVEPYWWELGWWFPQLSMLFVLSSVLIGFIARMGEKKLVGLITQGISDMVGPAIVIVLARSVAVLLNNTETLDTVLNAMEKLVDGTSAGTFAILVAALNMPLAFLIPSSSGHATLAMPLLAPLSDFAGVSRPLTITSFQMGHGLMLLIAPTNVVIVGGLAIAKVGYDKYLRFVAPLFGILAVTIAVILLIAAALD
jgi:uncharacterized ion transporter superfamily protein YfcC